MEKTMEELFYELRDVQIKTRLLAGIVQNEGFKPTKEQVIEWQSDVDKAIKMLKASKKNVSEYFEKEERTK